MATILELAELSAAVYGDAPVPTGWTKIQASTPASDGYLGVAYVNTHTKEIVIANRGTRRTSLADLLNDAMLLAQDPNDPDELSAIAFAKQIVKDFMQPGGQYAGYTLTETGHSLGGAEAQAATAALVDLGLDPSVSAVTFNSPGIASRLFNPTTSYNVLNLYTQGDIIHEVGGTHLGTTAVLATGPTLTQEYDALAVGAVIGGFLGGPGLAWLLGGVAWARDVLQAHVIKTTVGYLQGSSIGLENEAQFIQNLTQPSGPSSGVSLLSTAFGQFSLTGTNGTFSFDVPNSQGLTFSFQPGSTALPGSSMAFAQELANAGPINIPTQELNQILNSSTGATDIFAVANGSGTIDYFTLPGGPGTNPPVNQIVVSTTGAAAFDYNVPTGSQPMVEYIQDDGGNGSVSVNNGQALTPLTGGTPVAGTPWTWTDTHGTQYVFAPSASADPNVGTLTISGGLLGATAGNQIVIENFSLNTAETNTNGDLGIKFAAQMAVAADPSLASDPFRSGNYTPPNGAVTVSQGVAQSLTIHVSAMSSSPQPVTLSFSGGNLSAFAVDTGAVLLPIANGSVTLTVPAGADSLTVGLINTQDLTSNETLQVTAALGTTPPASGAAGNGALTVNFDTAGAFANPVTQSVIQGSVGTIQINGAPFTFTSYYGDGGNDLIQTAGGNNYVDASNSVTDRIVGGPGNDTLIGGSGNDLISGGGGQDYVFAGNGNNRVYGNSPVSLASALAAASSSAPTGKQGDVLSAGTGNNTLVGGNGNDLLFAGSGNDVIVLGPGSDTVWGGASAYLTPTLGTPSYGHLSWTAGPVVRQGGANWGFLDTIVGFGYGPVNGRVGNDTVFGGAGNDVFMLSTGNNYVDAGSGNDFVSAPLVGTGNNTIFGGTGNDVINGGAGNDYINAESGSDWVDGGGGNNTLIGGSGNDTLYAGLDNNLVSSGTWANSETGNNYLWGGSGNDQLYGAGGNDTLIGGSGNDSLYAGVGNEYLSGGSGNDLLVGGSGSGNDTLIAGGAGNDTLAAGIGTGTDVLTGGSGADTIYGSAASASTNVINAGSGNTVIYGGAGTDTIDGGNGTDSIYGGTGTEVLYAGNGGTTAAPTQVIAGSGSETLYGGGGVAVLNAQAGTNDLLVGGTGADTLLGGSGDDTLVAGNGNNVLAGGSGSNTYVFALGGGADRITQSAGVETLQFGPGITASDLVVTAEPGTNNTNLIIQYDANGSVTIDGGLNGRVGQIQFANGTQLTLDQLMAQASVMTASIAATNGDLLFAGGGNASLTGGAGNDTLYGWGANDTLTGGTGNEQLFGEDPSALLQGGSGTDTLTALAANDTLTGGSGNTTFVINDATDVVTDPFTSGTNTLLSSVSYVQPLNVQNLTLTGSADLTATGNSQSGVLTANTGNDTLVAGTGIDTLVGGSGNDTFVVNNTADVVTESPNTGNNTVLASVSYVQPLNVQNLTLTGSADLTATGNSQSGVLTANSGNDTLIAGTGIDTLVGGSGNDTFMVNNSADVIVEQPNTGDNTAFSSVSYALGANVQNLTLTGSADLTATGNGQNGVLTANTGNDTLIGGEGSGSETLQGGAGHDTFVLNWGMGADTAINASSQGSLVELGQGLSFSDLSAVQIGNDLQLSITGTTTSLVLKNYFTAPIWTIADRTGQAETGQQLIAATVQQQSMSPLAQEEAAFLAQTRSTIIGGLLAQGYVLQPDGTWVAPQTIEPVVAYDQVTTQQDVVTTDYTDGTVTTSTSTSSTPMWTPAFYSMLSGSASMDLVNTTSNASVIDTTSGASTNYGNSGSVWFAVAWTPGPSTTSTTVLKYSNAVYAQAPTGYGNILAGVAHNTNTTTVMQETVNGAVTAVLPGPGALRTSGADPQVVDAQNFNTQTTDTIEELTVGAGDHTVNAGPWTLVNSTTGNDLIRDAGFAYGGSGNDTLIGGGTLVAGSGNDLLIGGDTMIGGTGNDSLFGNANSPSGTSMIVLNANTTGTDLIGDTNADSTTAVLDAFYQAQGISAWRDRYTHGGLYAYYPFGPPLFATASVATGLHGATLQGFVSPGNPVVYGDLQDMIAYASARGLTLAQAEAKGLITYLAPLPVLAVVADNEYPPAPYYATANIPEVTFAANDYAALAPYYANGTIPVTNKVVFGPGITVASLHLSWGQVTGSLTGSGPQSLYTTLDLSWGPNQSVQVMIPHFNDPLGSGVQQFDFADGTHLSMAQMIALAPPAPSFDPELPPETFTFTTGMGQQVVGRSVGAIQFAAGITPADITVRHAGRDLLIYQNQGADVLRIPNWYQNPAMMPTVSATFSDGTTWNASELTTLGLVQQYATGDQVLTGLPGFPNVLIGAVNDTLVGGTGNDTFVVNDPSEVVIAQPNTPNNTILSSVSYTLPANVQNLTLTGSANLTATGNTLNDVLTGNAGNDTLIAGPGNDTLVSGAGVDTLIGGTGNDTFVVNNSADVIQEPAGAAGALVRSSVSYVLPANVADLTLTGSANLTATGNTLNDVLTANTGNDTLIAGSGIDTLIGGPGNDTFVVNNAQDVVEEPAHAAGATIRSSVSYVLPANVPNLTLTGSANLTATGNTLNDVLTANAGNDTLVAGSGNDTLVSGTGVDTLIGGPGNDTFVVNNAADVIQEPAGAAGSTVLASVSYVLPAHVENLTLTGSANLTATGNALNNIITGNAGNDTLIGGRGNDTLVSGSGIDTLIGGAGNNTFVVNNAADTIVARGGGHNTVLASVSYVLPAHVQALTLTGSANLTATGNRLNDVLTANSGNDTLISGTGVDTLIGGTGNDTFVVNNRRDVIEEPANAAGSTVLASVSYVLPTHVAALTLTGTRNLTGTANAGNDLLIANSGNDTLVGGTGVDVLQGGVGRDVLTDTLGPAALLAGSGTTTLTGGGFNDFLAVGAGGGTLRTGAGHSVIAFNQGDAATTLRASAGAADTLSLGGGIADGALSFQKQGQNLVLDTGTGSVTFQGWYASPNNHDVATLQVLEQASPDYNPASSNVLVNQKVETFNFTALVTAFDQARAANHHLTRWSLMNGLLTAHLAGSDTAALGGDLAYYEGTQGALTGMNLAAADAVLQDPAFGSAAQTIHPWAMVSAPGVALK
ncbi:MAG: lipase family protein [Acidiferrobacteraceae bacterium]